MKLEEIELIPLSKKKIIVREMCLLYKKLKLLEVNQKNGELLMNENRINQNKMEIHKTKSVFESILELLDKNQQLIIDKEFMNKKDDWSEDYWSRSTFYKRKNDAINTFIFYLYA
ncbi:MAG: MG284/MPN403 family protein [Metamycoplasmataceae bacterium]